MSTQLHQRQRRFSVLSKSKNELYLSLLVVWLGVFTPSTPLYLQGALTASGALLLGLACELNALLDVRRMNRFERVLALAWFGILLWLTWYFVVIYVGALTAYKVPFYLPWTARENR